MRISDWSSDVCSSDLHELKPLIAQRYPVDARRQTLFGHSYGGLFTLYTLFTKPQAFQGYVAASPSIWWYQGYVERTLAAFERQLADQPVTARLLVTAGGAEQPAARSEEHTSELQSLM